MSERSTCPFFARPEARPHLSTGPQRSSQFSATNDVLCERHLLFAVVVASATAARRTVEGAVAGSVWDVLGHRRAIDAATEQTCDHPRPVRRRPS